MRTSKRPGYIFDTFAQFIALRNHKQLVQELCSILDRAAVEYDLDEDVVDDFTAYVKDWAKRRDEKPER